MDLVKDCANIVLVEIPQYKRRNQAVMQISQGSRPHAANGFADAVRTEGNQPAEPADHDEYLYNNSQTVNMYNFLLAYSKYKTYYVRNKRLLQLRYQSDNDKDYLQQLKLFTKKSRLQTIKERQEQQKLKALATIKSKLQGKFDRHD